MSFSVATHCPQKYCYFISFPVSFTSAYMITINLIQTNKRTILTEQTPFVGEISSNFCGWRVLHGQRNGSPQPYSRITRMEPILLSSSSVVLTRLSGPETSGSVARKSEH
jgi:hypothetical protein